MPLQTNSKAQELLNSQLPASEQLNNVSTSSENYPIEHSPLWIRCREEKWFLTMGDHRVSREYETEKECRESLNTEFWQILITIVGIAIEKYNDKELHDSLIDRTIPEGTINN